jgi:hypothetical protein
MIKFLANVRNHLLIFGLLLTLSVLLLLGRFYVTQSVLGGDGVYYYAMIRSLVIDGDLDFQNEYEHFHQEASAFTGNPKIPKIPAANSITGKLPNRYPIGQPIALMPFFGLAHVVSLLLSAIGLPVAVDGYSIIYQLFTGLGSLLYGFLALIVIYLLGRRWFDSYSFDRFSYNSATAIAGTVGIGLATPVIYYMTMEPLMSHTTSMFFAALFVLVWYIARTKPSFSTAIGLGFLGGMIALTRYQDVLFLLIPSGDAIASVLNRSNSRSFGRRSAPQPLLLLGVVLITAALVISLQFYVNRILYGSFLTTGYSEIGEGLVNWNSPKLAETLFSLQGGLLLWSPIVIFSIAGLALFLRKQVLAGALLGLVLLSEWYLISAWSIPLGGDSFGSRKLLSCTVIFAIGLMQFLHMLEKQRSLYRALLSLIGILILVNGVLAGLYCFRVIGNPY